MGVLICSNIMGEFRMKVHFKELDFLRTIAIFIILLHHLPDHTFNFYNLEYVGLNYNLSWLNDLNRYFALGLFFYLSGFLLSDKNYDFSDWSRVKDYVVQKNIRILPLYVIALIIFILIFSSFIPHKSFFSFLLHCLGLQGVLASKYCDPVFTLWFVGVLMAFYYYFILIEKSYQRNIRLCIFIVSILPIILILAKYLFDFTDKRILIYYSVFVFGFFSNKFKIIENIRFDAFFGVLLVFLVTVYCYTSYIYPAIFQSENKPALFSVLGGLAFFSVNLIMLTFVNIVHFLFVSFLKYSNKTKRQSSAFWLAEKISFASFCMFLFHRPIWWAMLKIFNPANDIYRILYLFALGVPVIILSSYFVQKFYNQQVYPVFDKWIN